ncbi:MAG: winged helix-turn-helix domain-containing protein [Terriglobales bacterium]|jgi:TolB-like protein
MTNCAGVGFLRFDDFELDMSNRELRTAGTLVSLQPQPFKVLALLASHSGQTLTREEIRLQLWGSQTFVDFDSGLNFCIRQIRKALGEDARLPRYIETLSRRGYRFLAAVNRADNSENCVTQMAAKGTPDGSLGKAHSRPIISVAVLPFRELSCSAHASSLGDGITELLITYLSTSSSVRVVSRTSSMRYKDSAKSLLRIGRELRADRILEGAVLHSGEKVRITARLVDTTKDRNEWTGCYEAEMQDWLDLLADIAWVVIRDTARHLGFRLEETGAPSRRRPSGIPATYFQTFQLPPTIPLAHKFSRLTAVGTGG